jgi:hypothetical protein
MSTVQEETALVTQDEHQELSVAEVVAQSEKALALMDQGMKEGLHYGKIPGTDKPTLLQPGAEKICFMFRVSSRYRVEREDLPQKHIAYTVVCELTHIATGAFVGEGLGSASTMESKYRWRKGVEMTGRPVPGNYWNVRKENPDAALAMLGGKGFGTKKVNNQWQIVKYSDERVENPDIADQYNTVLKMARKRAYIDAVKSAFAVSDIFTQDIEDLDFPKTDKPADKTDDKSSDDPPDNDHKDEKRQMLINEIGEVMAAEYEGASVFTDEEKEQVRQLIPKAKTYKDLAAIRNTWTINRDQRLPQAGPVQGEFEDQSDG